RESAVRSPSGIDAALEPRLRAIELDAPARARGDRLAGERPTEPRPFAGERRGKRRLDVDAAREPKGAWAAPLRDLEPLHLDGCAEPSGIDVELDVREPRQRRVRACLDPERVDRPRERELDVRLRDRH